MYRLIVVDDETRARDIVARYIQKLGLGYEVTACLSDGAEAISYIQAHPVDVVLSDIKMPGVSGIELARHVQEEAPGCRVVLFSEYSEFEYARSAIQYGVFHYLLKPVDVGELADVLLRLKADMEEQRGKDDEEQVALRREQFVTDLLAGALRTEDITAHLRSLGFPFEADQSAGALVSLETQGLESFLEHVWSYGREKLRTALLNILQKRYMDGYVLPMGHAGGRFPFVIVYPDSVQRHQQRLAEATQDMQELLQLTVEVGELKVFDSLAALMPDGQPGHGKPEDAGLLVSQIQAGETDEAVRMLAGWLHQWRRSGMRLEEMVARLSTLLLSAGLLQKPLVVEQWADDESAAGALLSQVTWSVQQEDEVIRQARAYIELHFANDITRDEVAEHVYLNSAYFSRYFKRKTGISFYDYLTNVRMKHAVELLLTNKKIYEIVRAVGYTSSKHFLKIFKSYTGYTPTEYRRQVLRMEGAYDEEV